MSVLCVGVYIIQGWRHDENDAGSDGDDSSDERERRERERERERERAILPFNFSIFVPRHLVPSQTTFII